MKNETKDVKLNNLEKEKQVAVLEKRFSEVSKKSEEKDEAIKTLEKKIKENKEDYRR